MPVHPLPYHLSLVEYFKSHEPDLWEWCCSDDSRRKSADALRLELLKSTYRLPEGEHGRLYELGREAARRLNVDAPLTFYQAVDYGVMNAGMSRFPNEAHLVLCGPIANKLSDEELIALFGHELSHLKLWSDWDGQFLVVDEIIAALADDESQTDTYAATERLFHLYTEVFCDRGALQAAGGDCLTVIAVLIRIDTSMESIRPESFLQQVDEIFEKQQASTDGLTHPEAFIRAKAIQLWSELLENGNGESIETDEPDSVDERAVFSPSADAKDVADVNQRVALMLEGSMELERLDLIGRKRVEGHTRQLLNTLLTPSWMRTEANLNHARLYFPDYEFQAGDGLSQNDGWRAFGESVLDYFCYVLLDFATTDRGLEQMPLSLAIETARSLKLDGRFAPLAQKELRLRKRQYAEVAEKAASALAEAAESGESR